MNLFVKMFLIRELGEGVMAMRIEGGMLATVGEKFDRTYRENRESLEIFSMQVDRYLHDPEGQLMQKNTGLEPVFLKSSTKRNLQNEPLDPTAPSARDKFVRFIR